MGRKGSKFEERIYVPCASFTPSKVATWMRPVDGYHYSGKFFDNMINLEDNDHEGKISDKARKKIELAVTWLLFIAKPKLVLDLETGKKFKFLINFITLTLPAPQVHPDQQIKDICLNNFLQVCRKAGLKNYLWRAEAQPATGNIHFHITTDMFLHYDTIRQWWNQSLQLLGYLDSFALKHGHRNPNSTDVHSVKHVRKITSYISKYMGKNKQYHCIGELRLIKGETVEVMYKSDQYRKEGAHQKEGKLIGHVLGSRVRPIKGRLWGYSQSLSKPKSIVIEGGDQQFNTFTEFIYQSGFKKYNGDFVTMFFGNVAKEAREWFPQLYEEMQLEAQGKRGKLRPQKIASET